MAARGERAPGGRLALALTAAIVIALALGVRLAGLGHTPHTDEIAHLLAARSWLDSGRLAIADGDPYERAQLFTKGVAALCRIFGESIALARAPAVAAGVGLVLAVFLWVRAALGRVAGLTAAILLALDPRAVHLSQTAGATVWPFLCSWLGAIAAYELGCDLAGGDERPRAWRPALARRAALALGAAAAFGLALAVEPRAAVVLLGVGFWAAVTLGSTLLGRAGSAAERRDRALVALALVLVAAIVAVESGLAASVWRLCRSVPPDARAHRADLGFYCRLLAADYGSWWPLLPLAWIAAAVIRPRPLGFLGIAGGVSFVCFSIAAGKDDGLLGLILPYFAAISGGAAGVVLPRAAAAIEGLLAPRAGGSSGRRARWAGATAGVIVVASLVPIIAGTGAFGTTWKMLTVSDAEWTGPRGLRGEADWVAAAGELRAVADSVDVLVSSNDVKALYALGRVDYVLGVRGLVTAEGRAREFTRSSRVGRPLVSAPESVARVMETHARGLIVIEKADWHAGWGVPAGTANLISAYSDPVPIPAEYRIIAFRWRPLAE